MKLSEINYQDLIFKSKSDDLKKIVFTEDYTQTEQKCDVGIVFGGISMIPHRVDAAVDMYQRRLLNRIIVTGGIGFLSTDRNTPEAFKMYNYLLEHDIPKEDILIEPKSRNTLENITFLLEVLASDYNLNNTSLMLITSDFHLRRCLGIIQMQLNQSNNIYGYGVKDGKIDIDSWEQSLKGKKLILQEALLLCYYAKKQIMEDVNIKGLNFKKYN